MKLTLRVAVTGVLVASLLALPLLPDADIEPMAVVETRLALAFAAEDGEDGAWVSAPIEEEATVVGLTWDDPGDAPDEAEVRVEVEGTWGDWEPVEVDDEHAPDPGSSEDLAARGGTAPIVVEGADAVQFRVEGQDAPEEVMAEVIDVDDPDGRLRVEGRPAEAEAAPAQPSINRRSAWNADSCVRRDPDDIDYGERVKVLFVHHTTGYTSYSRSQVPGIVRAICSYHVSGRGWSDIGYNALVDRYGGIWEGRAGGLARHPIGAHTGGFNSQSSGVAFIGDHETGGAPTSAAQDALRRYAAWKLDVHNIDPRGRYSIRSGGSSRHAAGTVVGLDAISGHRDASYTACPGRACYSLLDDFMVRVDNTGGFKTFGGWPRVTRASWDGSRWSTTTVDLEFSERADWTLEVRDGAGRAVHRASGRDVATVVRWDGRLGNGAAAPAGKYTVRTTARAVSNGAAASPADHLLELGVPPGTFDDVPWDHTFVEDIRWLALEGITKGCDPPANTRFCPGDDVNREQMAAFLNRALNLPNAPHAGFVDVPRSHTFAQDIANLAAAGITRGCGDPSERRFCPDDTVRRKQMAAFLVRAAELSRINHPGFDDVRSGSTFDADIRRLATAGITYGCNPPSNSRFCPDRPVTRAQMSAFIRRTMQEIG